MPAAIRVMHVGLGPIGASIVQHVAARPGLKIVGAVDVDAAKVGRDIGDVAGLSRRLGDLGYGIYLLHGLLLFATLHFAVGENRAVLWSDAQHAALLTALAPVVVVLAHAAFRWVEAPAMAQTGRLVAWWRARHP